MDPFLGHYTRFKAIFGKITILADCGEARLQELGFLHLKDERIHVTHHYVLLSFGL